MGITNINSIKKMEDITKEKGNSNLIKIFKGSAIAIVLSLIFLTIYAAILSFTSVSETTMVPVVLVLTGISILIGSSMSSISIKRQGIINGGLVGLIYVLFLYIVSSIAGVGFGLNMNSIIMLAVGIITGMIGGVIGVNIKWIDKRDTPNYIKNSWCVFM